MGYIREWDDFVTAARQLFQEYPGQVRYSMKYRHCDGKLVLKVTNNSEVRASGVVVGAIAPWLTPDSVNEGADRCCRWHSVFCIKLTRCRT